MPPPRHRCLCFSLVLLLFWPATPRAAGPPAWPSPHFAIRVVDARTGRGVPLTELRTVNDMVFYSDSAGRVAFLEPGLMSRDVWFSVSAPGYELPADGFGNRGVRLKTTPGKTVTLRLKRTNAAERLYRITGQGIYRDSALLGLPYPASNLEAGVVGQDSVQAVPYRGKLFWLWGDTSEADYPLGNFQTTAATSPLPGKDCQPSVAIPLRYLTDPANPRRVRRMVPLGRPGPVWLFGLLTVADDRGKEALVAHFTRHKSLTEVIEHGLVRFDDRGGVFQKIQALDPYNRWRFPRGNAFRVREGGADYFCFASPFAHTRVRADWASLLDASRYEAWAFDRAAGRYAWARKADPTTQMEERKWLASGAMKAAAAHFDLRDGATGKPVRIHGASIARNGYRKKWILIGVEQAGRDAPSHLGEVWYAEADSPVGPWRKAVKIASHPGYTFYNPRHHAFFDEADGRVIYFEGTYTRTFSGNPVATPRYEYNQLLYRLDLADRRLEAAR